MSKEVTGFKPGSKSWKNFMAKLYGIGGGVVIIGALFKLQHYPGSEAMLIAGLGTEAIIFFFSAFEPLHEDPKWELVYPELAEDFDGEPIARGGGGFVGGGSASTTQELDVMLEEAKIGPELIESLGEGLRNLNTTATNMNSLGDAAGATNEFVDNVKSAATRVGSLSESYERAAEALMGLSVSNDDGATYAENLKKVSENLAALNNVYELQLKSSSEHLETANQAYGGISELLENLNTSLESTRKYKDSIGELSDNIASLNTVYGNMLNAMNYSKPQV